MRRWAGIWIGVAMLGMLSVAACGSGSGSTTTKVHTTDVVFAFVRPRTTASDRARTAALMQARFRALGARDTKVDLRDGRLVATGPTSLRRLAAAVVGRGLIEFRPVRALLPPAGADPRGAFQGGDIADGTALVGRGDASSAPRYLVGPAALTGGVASASAAARNFGASAGWVVDFSLTRAGKRSFNQLAAASFPQQPPQNSAAIVLDGVVQTAPAFSTPSFNGDVQISGSFTRAEAEALAAVLNTGAFPAVVHRV